jgi:CRP/FNR family transcriptional regulator
MTILFQGEVPPMALFISSGFVAAYTIKNSGDEQIVSLFSKGDIIPAEWLFGRSPVALYYYKAFTDCELVAVDRQELLSQIAKNHALSAELLERFVGSFIGATIHIHALEHSYSREKLIKLFHYLVLRFGEAKPGKHGVYTLPLPLTHAQIASMIGLTRETVTTETVKLKKKGVLQHKSGVYTINLPSLLKSLGSEEFDNLNL